MGAMQDVSFCSAYDCSSVGQVQHSTIQHSTALNCAVQSIIVQYCGMLTYVMSGTQPMVFRVM